jgi:hypothetical protein
MARPKTPLSPEQHRLLGVIQATRAEELRAEQALEALILRARGGEIPIPFEAIASAAGRTAKWVKELHRRLLERQRASGS